MMSETLPDAFLTRLKAILPPECHDQVLDSFARPKHTCFRVNPLKTGSENVVKQLAEAGFTLSAVAGLESVFSIPPEQRRRLTETPTVRDGLAYIQNPSSMLPPIALAPSADDRVLDLAAAPGSKTLQLSAMLGNTGWISAVEAVRSRFFRLKTNLQRHGAANVHTYLADGALVWRKVPEQFDKVLLDAPCSSEGQFVLSSVESFKYWRPKKIKEMARKQQRLLFSAIQSLKPGGELVYSTCTFAPEENEAVIDNALSTFGDAIDIVSVELATENVLPGLGEWQGKRYSPALERAVRVIPDDRYEGFFLCKLTKRSATLSGREGRPR